MKINPQVEEFLDKTDHPLIPEMQRVRELILTADFNVEETIKWKSPTFMYKGNMASFNMNAKKMISLMFHTGATINDPSGLLSGDGKEARVARFKDVEEIEARKDDLQAVVREWVRMKG